MDFYFDANIPEALIKGFVHLEKPFGKNNIYSTAEIWGHAAADEEIIPGISSRKGIFITNDVKIYRLQHQVELISGFDMGTFFLSFPKNFSYWDRVKMLVEKWEDIKKAAEKGQRHMPYAYKVKMRGKLEELGL